MENIKGKVLKNEKDEDFLILDELIFKSMKCVYAMKVGKSEEKAFFQVSDGKLLSITSDKMIADLSKKLFNENRDEGVPRNIKDNESISDYFNYLDEFYKKQIIPKV